MGQRPRLAEYAALSKRVVRRRLHPLPLEEAWIERARSGS